MNKPLDRRGEKHFADLRDARALGLTLFTGGKAMGDATAAGGAA